MLLTIFVVLFLLGILIYVGSIFSAVMIMVDHDIDISLIGLLICACPILNTWIAIKYGNNGFKDIFNKLKND